eukprot:1687819-Pleurochrysis_carterae.AAC.1
MSVLAPASAHAHAFPHAHAHALGVSCTNACTRTRARAHARADARARARADTRARTLVRVHEGARERGRAPARGHTCNTFSHEKEGAEEASFDAGGPRLLREGLGAQHDHLLSPVPHLRRSDKSFVPLAASQRGRSGNVFVHPQRAAKCKSPQQLIIGASCQSSHQGDYQLLSGNAISCCVGSGAVADAVADADTGGCRSSNDGGRGGGDSGADGGSGA